MGRRAEGDLDDERDRERDLAVETRRELLNRLAGVVLVLPCWPKPAFGETAGGAPVPGGQ